MAPQSSLVRRLQPVARRRLPASRASRLHCSPRAYCHRRDVPRGTRVGGNGPSSRDWGSLAALASHPSSHSQVNGWTPPLGVIPAFSLIAPPIPCTACRVLIGLATPFATPFATPHRRIGSGQGQQRRRRTPSELVKWTHAGRQRRVSPDSSSQGAGFETLAAHQISPGRV